MSATEVIIHFVGLCLFSAGVPNDPGVHAILPRITSELHEHGQIAVGQISAPEEPSAEIEPHVTMLVFHKDLVDDDSQWPAALIPGASNALQDYRQVTLDGEHVTFLADGVNPPLTALPVPMPRFRCASSNGNPSLTSDYQFPYGGAAAVVDIPEGVLEACRPGAVAATRVDTKLTLNTSGKLTVVAMKAGEAKVLILETTTAPRIYLINVPNQWAAGNQTPSYAGEKHYVAYYRMIGKYSNSACNGPPVVRQSSLAALPSCASTGSQYRQMASANANASLNPVLAPATANTECSNSAWP